MSYGVEIWGWKEREGMERLEERYLRWIFGLDRRNAGVFDKRRDTERKIERKGGKKSMGV